MSWKSTWIPIKLDADMTAATTIFIAQRNIDIDNMKRIYDGRLQTDSSIMPIADHTAWKALNSRFYSILFYSILFYSILFMQQCSRLESG